MSEYVVMTFESTTAAMAFEEICLEKGMPGRLIPTPQSISAGCGLVWRVKAEEFDESQFDGMLYSDRVMIEM